MVLKKQEKSTRVKVFGLDNINEEIAVLITQYFRHKAEKKFLPVPPINDKDGFWEQGQYTGKWYLTKKGITELQSLIRKDGKEKREMFSYWISILFGLIGAITGLIAVIKR